MLELGLVGFEERTRQAKANLDLTDPASIDKYHFYDSILITIDAVKTYADRFVALAKEMAETATAKRRKSFWKLLKSVNGFLIIQLGLSPKLFNQFGSSNVFFK